MYSSLWGLWMKGSNYFWLNEATIQTSRPACFCLALTSPKPTIAIISASRSLFCSHSQLRIGSQTDHHFLSLGQPEAWSVVAVKYVRSMRWQTERMRYGGEEEEAQVRRNMIPTERHEKKHQAPATAGKMVTNRFSLHSSLWLMDSLLNALQGAQGISVCCHKHIDAEGSPFTTSSCTLSDA